MCATSKAMNIEGRANNSTSNMYTLYDGEIFIVQLKCVQETDTEM